MKRRSYVESSYGNIKNEAEQNLRRPSVRVMGRAKMTFISAVVVAAANLRMGRLWTRRQHRLRTGEALDIITCHEAGHKSSPARRSTPKAAGSKTRRDQDGVQPIRSDPRTATRLTGTAVTF